MRKRPLSVTIIACIYIVTGAVGLIYHASDFKAPHPFQLDVLGIAAVRALAIVAGVFMLRGQNWARWLALAWMAFHVVIGGLNSVQQMAIHAVILAIIAFFLLRRPSAEYFRGSR